MFTNLRLWANILLGMGIAIVIAVTALTVASLRHLDGVVSTAEQATLRQYAGIIKVNIDHETRTAQTLSALVANIPEIRQHFAAGDRAWLQDQLLPAYKVLEQDYGAVQFQFHTPPATSFLRLHKPEKYGDDLSGFRHSVVTANTQLKPQRGLEVGVADLGARGMVPVFEQGRHLGSVEFGMSFGPTFFAAFKENYGVDAALHVMRDGVLTTFAGTRGEQPLLDPEAIQAAFAGTPQSRNVLIDGRPLAVYAEVVHDYSGAPLGVVEVAMDRSESLAALNHTTRLAWFAGGLMMLLGLIIALVTARTLARRIGLVAAGVNRVAAGDLSGQIVLSGRDELAELAQVANQMRQRLHDLVAQVGSHSGAVDGAAREIARSVDSQAAISSQMSASVAEITSTMEELSASSSQIAEYSGSVVEIARRTYDDSLQGADAMQQLVVRMEEIRQDNQHSLKEIVDLGGKSKEISKIMQIIDTVADQTKLIAFNAALEASSAGEAGKRFGVVAAEIRRLADSVTESTGEIAKKVGEIQESIGRLVITSEKGALGIEQGMNDSSRTAAFLQDLVQAASETTSSAQQISLSTQQQRTASNQVVVALREIVTASSDTAQSVRHISQVTQEMTRLSADLKFQVDRFTLDETARDTVHTGA
ncbi:methyl-accepting chemotaxis protein [Thiobaca trueperi]|uniref:Methyl-accepting chemotaxis protein n=1 Tax=Thiobaca trueperi TaxID=127458 RepID=A0A4R3MUX1_9GAMM|nr:methyl-accepting chemotaxis protein [Thiobaca trueperi]TCT20300.1 methyl-accepting chemotaxis protein [Thiobaca trueperi]